MAKNVQGVLFLRNGSLYQTHEAAVTAIQNHGADLIDGQAILARYTAEDTTVKTIVGFKYVGGGVSSLTLIDIEDIKGDAEALVEALRTEINNKLGTGVTSAASETVTAQLEALSGATFTAGTSSSADTSVEGAKAYAYDLIGTLDYTDTAVADSYVSEVTQSDGKIISTTKVALPSVTGEVESKKVVMSVSEDKGTISVDKGTIESADKTVVISDVTDASDNVTGIDFKVNIDNETLIANTGTGVISVASAALTQYVGDEDTIHISAVDSTTNTKTISSPLTISATTPSEANVKEQYNLVGASGNTIGATIKIYKDSALLSVALLHAITTENPQVLPTYNKATDTWTDIDATAQTQANQALCYAYEDVSGNTVVAAVPVGSFINEQEFASGLTWDVTENKVRGVVDPTSEKDSNNDPFLTVDANGFKVDGIKDEIAAQLGDVVADLDATVTGATSGNHITISIEELDGKLVQSGLTIEEDDIASASDLAALSAKTVTEIGSSNASIAVSTATTTADDGTVKYDIVTDADKILMSGFTTTTASSFSGIAEADSIATAFEKADAVITENERITAAALNDLNDKIEAVSGASLSGVSVNNVELTPSNNAVNIQISGSTAAPSGTVNDPAIIVNTDANGAVTLGIGYIDCGTYDD